MATYVDRRALAEAIVAKLKEPKKTGALPPEYGVEQFRERYRDIIN